MAMIEEETYQQLSLWRWRLTPVIQLVEYLTVARWVEST